MVAGFLTLSKTSFYAENSPHREMERLGIGVKDLASALRNGWVGLRKSDAMVLRGKPWLPRPPWSYQDGIGSQLVDPDMYIHM